MDHTTLLHHISRIREDREARIGRLIDGGKLQNYHDLDIGIMLDYIKVLEDGYIRIERQVDKIRYAMDVEIEQGNVVDLLDMFDADSGKLK